MPLLSLSQQKRKFGFPKTIFSIFVINLWHHNPRIRIQIQCVVFGFTTLPRSKTDISLGHSLGSIAESPRLLRLRNTIFNSARHTGSWHAMIQVVFRIAGHMTMTTRRHVRLGLCD